MFAFRIQVWTLKKACSISTPTLKTPPVRHQLAERKMTWRADTMVESDHSSSTWGVRLRIAINRPMNLQKPETLTRRKPTLMRPRPQEFSSLQSSYSRKRRKSRGLPTLIAGILRSRGRWPECFNNINNNNRRPTPRPSSNTTTNSSRSSPTPSNNSTGSKATRAFPFQVRIMRQNVDK